MVSLARLLGPQLVSHDALQDIHHARVLLDHRPLARLVLEHSQAGVLGCRPLPHTILFRSRLTQLGSVVLQQVVHRRAERLDHSLVLRMAGERATRRERSGGSAVGCGRQRGRSWRTL